MTNPTPPQPTTDEDVEKVRGHLEIVGDRRTGTVKAFERLVARLRELEEGERQIKKAIDKGMLGAAKADPDTSGDATWHFVLAASEVANLLASRESLIEKDFEELVNTIMDNNAELYQRLAGRDEEEPPG